MTMHYYGTPITPRSVLYTLAGKSFCVSLEDSSDVELCHRIGQSVMLDNGAYSHWKRNGNRKDWSPYYEWVKPWLEVATTWAVIPDVVDGGEVLNDRLLAEWFVQMGSYRRAAPVWHIDESLTRLERLSRNFERICFGSAGAFADISTNAWNNRMNETFNFLCKGSGAPPCHIHMLRGMQLADSIYPFHSLDSASIARNHQTYRKSPRQLMDEWDATQCPIRWIPVPIRQPLFEGV